MLWSHITINWRLYLWSLWSLLEFAGDTGQGLRGWVRDVAVPDLAFGHIRVVYPTAPARYATTGTPPPRA